jgi:hypothetical protein
MVILIMEVCSMADFRTCGFCRERIRGRSDKKFCNDVCRNAFNNRLNGELNASIRAVNSKLKRNRRVLESLLPDGSPFIKLKKQALLNRGFHLNYQTHTRLSPQGSLYSFCYEYGYTLIGDDVVVVRKKITEE